MKPERGDRIKGEAVKWAMPLRIPFGDVTMIAGRDGAAKSTYACHLTAAFTRGEYTGKKENVYLVMAEDHYRRIVKPRLEVAGADPKRWYVVPRASGIAFPGAAGELAQYVKETKSRVIIIDPLDSFIRQASRGREGVDEIKDMAEDLDVAVVILHHFNRRIDGKNLEGSIGGGRGLMAAMRGRFAWGYVQSRAADMPDDERLYGLIHLKNSYEDKQDPLLFAGIPETHPFDPTQTVLRLEDRGEYPLTGEHLFPKDAPVRLTKIERATALIFQYLEEQEEMPAAALEAAVVESGISKRTFETARSRLAKAGHIEADKRSDGWWWKLTPVDAGVESG